MTEYAKDTVGRFMLPQIAAAYEVAEMPSALTMGGRT